MITWSLKWPNIQSICSTNDVSGILRDVHLISSRQKWWAILFETLNLFISTWVRAHWAIFFTWFKRICFVLTCWAAVNNLYDIWCWWWFVFLSLLRSCVAFSVYCLIKSATWTDVCTVCSHLRFMVTSIWCIAYLDSFNTILTDFTTLGAWIELLQKLRVVS